MRGVRYKNIKPGDPPTERQRMVYDFIKAYKHKHGYCPSIREMNAGTGIKSPNGMVCHLDALEKRGMIKRPKEAGKSRAIVLCEEEPAVQLLREVLRTATEFSPGCGVGAVFTPDASKCRCAKIAGMVEEFLEGRQ